MVMKFFTKFVFDLSPALACHVEHKDIFPTVLIPKFEQYCISNSRGSRLPKIVQQCITFSFISSQQNICSVWNSAEVMRKIWAFFWYWNLIMFYFSTSGTSCIHFWWDTLYIWHSSMRYGNGLFHCQIVWWILFACIASGCWILFDAT